MYKYYNHQTFTNTTSSVRSLQFPVSLTNPHLTINKFHCLSSRSSVWTQDLNNDKISKFLKQTAPESSLSCGQSNPIGPNSLTTDHKWQLNIAHFTPKHRELQPQLTKAKHYSNLWGCTVLFFFFGQWRYIITRKKKRRKKKTVAAQRVVLDDSKMQFYLRVLLDPSRENAHSPTLSMPAGRSRPAQCLSVWAQWLSFMDRRSGPHWDLAG